MATLFLRLNLKPSGEGSVQLARVEIHRQERWHRAIPGAVFLRTINVGMNVAGAPFTPWPFGTRSFSAGLFSARLVDARLFGASLFCAADLLGTGLFGARLAFGPTALPPALRLGSTLRRRCVFA